MKKQTPDTIESCTRSLLPIRDTLYILNGKWKLPIMFALMFDNLRFTEMEREIKGITPKMLAKELKELEINQLIKKTPIGNREDIVQYTITPYGRTLKKIIVEIEMWGIKHRETIMGIRNKELEIRNEKGSEEIRNKELGIRNEKGPTNFDPSYSLVRTS